MRDELGTLVEELEETCEKFEIAKQRRLERQAKVAEKKAAKNCWSRHQRLDRPLARRHCGSGRSSCGAPSCWPRWPA